MTDSATYWSNWGLGGLMLLAIGTFIVRLLWHPPPIISRPVAAFVESHDALKNLATEQIKTLDELKEAFRGLVTLREQDNDHLAVLVGKFEEAISNSKEAVANTTRAVNLCERTLSKIKPREQWSQAKREAHRKEAAS